MKRFEIVMAHWKANERDNTVASQSMLGDVYPFILTCLGVEHIFATTLR